MENKENLLDDKKTEESENKKRLEFFSVMALPTLIYTILITIFRYENVNGISVPMATVCTIYYVQFVCKKLNKSLRSGWIFYAIGMLLLQSANIFTANKSYAMFSNVLSYCLFVAMLLHIYCDATKWSVTAFLNAFCLSLVGVMAGISDSLSDAILAIKNSKNTKNKTGVYCLIGVLIFIPFGIVLLLLLSSADAVFAGVVNEWLKWMTKSEHIFLIPAMIILVYVATYAIISSLEKGIIREKDTKNKWPMMVANTVLTLTGIIYLAFSLIQIFSLFLGKMQLPEGYTFAEYAREGFTELMVVCLINLVLVLIVRELFEKGVFTKILLAVICGCTFIMIASSAMRMCMYIEAYNLSRTRVNVIWVLIITAILMAFLTVSVFVEKLPLVRIAMVVVTLGFSVLTFVKPDAIVAKYNMSHIKDKPDLEYLTSLSADVAPYICEESGAYVDSYFHNIEEIAKEEHATPMQFNFSINKAMHLK